jgi:cytidine deaminase
MAIGARQLAYAPYSGFLVGAAVESENGRIFTGVNVENASYGLTVCAERNAIFSAVSAGESRFRRLAVAADTNRPTAPCGACRQVMREFDIPLITMGNMQGDVRTISLQDLLPDSFGPEDLKGDYRDPK